MRAFGRMAISLALVLVAAAATAACGGYADEDFMSAEEAIERALDQLTRPAPGIGAVEEIRNPVAWRTTLGEYQSRIGDEGTNESTRPVWVVHVEGRWTNPRAFPPGDSAWREGYIIGVLDAETGFMFSRRHSEEPFAWPVATDAPSMSGPERFSRTGVAGW